MYLVLIALNVLGAKRYLSESSVFLKSKTHDEYKICHFALSVFRDEVRLSVKVLIDHSFRLWLHRIYTLTKCGYVYRLYLCKFKNS